MARKVPSLDNWTHRRNVWVDLDEDLKVEFRLPDLGVWIAQGKVPNPLRAMAEQIEYSVVQPTSMDDEDRKTYYDLQAFVIATHLLQPNLMEMFEDDPEDVKPRRTKLDKAMEWVMDEMPPTHRDLIWLRAFHIIPDDVMASITDLLPFREGQPISGPQGDSDKDRTSS